MKTRRYGIGGNPLVLVGSVVLALAVADPVLANHAEDVLSATKFGRLMAAAEESLSDGDYEEARERIQQASKIPADDREFRDLLIKLGLDRGIIQADLKILAAEIHSAEGNKLTAKSNLETAQKLLRSKRTPANADAAQILWLLHSHLETLLGDLDFDKSYGLRAYAVNDDAKKIIDGHPRLKDAFRERDSKLKSAANKYENARDILLDPARGGARNATQLPRILRSLARAERGRGDLRMADEYYEDAERSYRLSEEWKAVIDPDSKFPLAMNDSLQKLKQNKNAQKSDEQELKNLFRRTVGDWMTLICERAELLAMRSVELMKDNEKKAESMLDDAETSYRKAIDLCNETYPKRHPLPFRVRMSLSRFYLARAAACWDDIEAEKKKGNGADPQKLKKLGARMASFLNDADREVSPLAKELGILHARSPLRVEFEFLHLQELYLQAANGQQVNLVAQVKRIEDLIVAAEAEERKILGLAD